MCKAGVSNLHCTWVALFGQSDTGASSRRIFVSLHLPYAVYNITLKRQIVLCMCARHSLALHSARRRVLGNQTHGCTGPLFAPREQREPEGDDLHATCRPVSIHRGSAYRACHCRICMHTGPRGITGRRVECVSVVYSHGSIGVGSSVRSTASARGSDDAPRAFAPAWWEAACDNRAGRDRPDSDVYISQWTVASARQSYGSWDVHARRTLMRTYTGLAWEVRWSPRVRRHTGDST